MLNDEHTAETEDDMVLVSALLLRLLDEMTGKILYFLWKGLLSLQFPRSYRFSVWQTAHGLCTTVTAYETAQYRAFRAE